jgi:hypothetical protein
MASDATVDRDGLRWIGGVALIVGGTLILTNALFPRPDNPSDYANFLARMVENSARTQAVLLAVPMGLWILLIGIAGIYRSIMERLAASWASAGLYLFLVGTALATVQFALGAGALAEAMRGAVETGVYLLAAGSYVRSFGMTVLWLGLFFVAIGMLMSTVYPRWAGWALLVLGVAMVMVSGVAITTGATQLTMAISGIVATLTAFWAVVVGVWITRRKVTPIRS